MPCSEFLIQVKIIEIDFNNNNNNNNNKYYKYESQPVSENSYYDLFCDSTIRTDLTVQNNRPDRVLLDRTIKEAYFTDIAIPKCRSLSQHHR